MTKESNNQQTSEAEGTAQTTQSPTGEVKEEQEQAAEVKPQYVPKYILKKASQTKGFEFKEVTYREVLCEDMTTAQRVCGSSEGDEFARAIMAQVCEFDGKKATYEDLQRLRWGDFLELRSLLTDSDWMGSHVQLSYSLAKLGLT